MHKSVFCTFLRDYAQMCAFLQAIFGRKKRTETHRKPQKRENAQERAILHRCMQHTDATAPFIIPLLACTQVEFDVLCLVQKVPLGRIVAAEFWEEDATKQTEIS